MRVRVLVYSAAGCESVGCETGGMWRARQPGGFVPGQMQLAEVHADQMRTNRALLGRTTSWVSRLPRLFHSGPFFSLVRAWRTSH